MLIALRPMSPVTVGSRTRRNPVRPPEGNCPALALDNNRRKFKHSKKNRVGRGIGQGTAVFQASTAYAKELLSPIISPIGAIFRQMQYVFARGTHCTGYMRAIIPYLLTFTALDLSR